MGGSITFFWRFHNALQPLWKREKNVLLPYPPTMLSSHCGNARRMFCSHTHLQCSPAIVETREECSAPTPTYNALQPLWKREKNALLPHPPTMLSSHCGNGRRMLCS